MSDYVREAEIARLTAERRAAPTVKRLFHILRASGYGFDSCILEYFDNSIDAGATKILIRFFSDKKGKLNKIVIIDNGCGMTLEALVNSFCIGDENNEEREGRSGRIGKYGAGWKTASINLANKVYFMTRKNELKTIVGLFADIETMETENSYRSTATYEDVRNELTVMAPLANLIPTTGSVIILTDLNDLAKLKITEAKKILLETLRTTYNVPNTEIEVQCDNEERTVCKLFDPIYTNEAESEKHLEYKPVRKTLRLYENKEGVRVCEKTAESWKEYLQLGHDGVKCMCLQKAKYPNEEEFLGEVQLTLVQVKYDTIHKYEPKLGIDSSKFRYFTVQRGGVRTLIHGVKLGGKLPERTVSSDQWQRCLINFPETLDKQFGGSFNKLASNNIPCLPLRRALHFIYLEVIAPWNIEYAKTHKKGDSKSATTETSHVPAVWPKDKLQNEDVTPVEDDVASEDTIDSFTENTIMYNEEPATNVIQMLRRDEQAVQSPPRLIVPNSEVAPVESIRRDSPTLIVSPMDDAVITEYETVEPVEAVAVAVAPVVTSTHFICHEHKVKIPFGSANPRALTEWYSGLSEEDRVKLQLAFPLNP